MSYIKIIILILLALALSGCSKDDTGNTVVEQEVSFNIDLLGPGGLKSGLPLCQTDIQGNMLMPAVLEVEFYNQEIGPTPTSILTPQVFVLGDALYSQAIKLAPGKYTITNFLLRTGVGGTILMAVPTAASEFGMYVANGVEFEFEVTAFDKVQVDIQVLCFAPEAAESFGFFWFHTTDLIIREQCFFGDLCIKNPQDYAGSYYEHLFDPLSNYAFDLPAIFKIEVIRNGGDWSKTFYNIKIVNGVATEFIAPLCVKYPDRLAKEDMFEFKLYIYVRQGSGFVYKHFHTWTIFDDEPLPSGSDGIVDFVVGNCNYNGGDLILPPYQNLPNSAMITITKPGDPGYVDLLVTSVVPAGNYDLPLGAMAGWSGNMSSTIPDGTQSRNNYVYSSLYPANWPPGVPYTPQELAKVNWLFNNLGSFEGFSTPSGQVINTGDFTQEQGLIIQDAIWEILHGGTGISGMAMDMANAAADKQNFSPLPGGWAAILCVAFNKPVQHQLILTVVDP